MKIITHEDIVNLNISPKNCLDWINEILLKKEETTLPPKISLKPIDKSFCNVMPALLPKNNTYGGVKIVTRFPNKIPSLDSKIMLFNQQTGEISALIDANWITSMRTGAVAAHSANLLSLKNYSDVGLIGLGNTARATVLCLSELIKDRKITFKLLKYKEQEILFKERFKEIKNFEFKFVDTYKDTIKDSDLIISSATYFEDDITDDNDLFKKGVTLIPIHTRGFSNCDLFFDKVFADDKGHVCKFKYFDKFKQFAEISDILTNKTKGRETEKERILVYNIGIAIHDIYFASKIYEMLETKKLKELSFNEPNEKFYI